MLNLFKITILIFIWGVQLVCAQASEIRILEVKRENIQKIMRVYQDSLADLDFLIAELNAGSSVDYSEVVYYKKVQTKNETKKSELVISNSGPNKIGTQASSSNKAKAISPYFKKNINRKVKDNVNRSSPITLPEKVQTKKYRRRVGAICNDGSRSYATGRGACSHHGGVRHWLIE